MQCHGSWFKAGQRHRGLIPLDNKVKLLFTAPPILAQESLQVIKLVDFLVVRFDNRVARQEASRGGRRAGLHSADTRGAVFPQRMVVNSEAGQSLVAVLVND